MDLGIGRSWELVSYLSWVFSCRQDGPGSTGVGSLSLSRGTSDPGIKPGSLALQADSLPAELPRKPLCHLEELNNRFSLAGQRKLVL